MATSYEQILTETDDTIRVLVMNRPDRLNAWTPQMGIELMAAIREANDDPSVEGMILTGAGRGFCAGADIEAVFKSQADGEGNAGTADMNNWVELVRTCKPIVAAINGAAIGVGLTQALPCDMLVASREAKLSLRFIKMGLVPELASSKFLTLRCGFGAASELNLTGKTITGEEAAAIGMVDRATAPDEVMSVALECVRSMAENPLAAVRKVKELLTLNASENDLDLIQKREGRALVETYKSAEHKEAIAAFMEKRDPDFRAARLRS